MRAVIPAELPQRYPRLAEMIGIDLRSLALFRVLLGLVLSCVIVGSFGDLAAFWTDGGLMPRDWLVRTDSLWRLSLYLVNGQTWFVALLMLVQLAAALMFALGWRMRTASIVSFVLWVSLVNRNPLVLTGADQLLCCLLFWAMFLPLSARYSVDAALATNPPPADNRHVSWATLGLLLQIASVYLFSGLMKSGREWFPEFTAIYYALSIDRGAWGLAGWLLAHPSLMKALSAYVWFLELLAAPLLFLPYVLRPLRLAVLVLLALMHIGFLLTLQLGHFPFVCLAMLSVFIGGWLWDALARRRDARRSGAPLRLYYDRDCAFCFKSCLILRELLLLPQLQIAPAQDSPRARTLLEAKRSWVLIDADDQAHLKWSALTVLMRRSPVFGWLWPLLRRPALARPGDAVYDFVGDHRPALSAVSASLLPQRAVAWDLKPFWHGVAGVFAVLVVIWNLHTVGLLPQASYAAMTPAFRILRLDQLWNLFAPWPNKEDGWWLAPAKLGDGSEIDLLHPSRGAPDYSKAAEQAAGHAGLRWLALHGRLWEEQYADHRRHYADYLCGHWNLHHHDDPARRALSLKLVYMLERTPPPGGTAQLEQVVTLQHQCYATPPAP